MKHECAGMEDAAKSFHRRQQRVARRHRRMADGYVTRLNENGLFEQRPVRDWRGLLLRPLTILVALFFVLKLIFVVYLGVPGYEAQLATFQEDTLGDVTARVVMQLDPITRSIAETLRTLAAPA